MNALLISIKPHHAQKIKRGEKTVELRRIAPKIVGEVMVFIYESYPVMAVTATALLSRITTLAVDDLWQLHGSQARITESEYYAYYEGKLFANALHIEQVSLLEEPLTLAQMREWKMIQQPPQSYCYISKERLQRPVL